MPKLKLLFILILFAAGVNATNILQSDKSDMDSVKISLLTCAPGEIIYTLFGHTGIRYENPSRNIDVVFNYGLFNFGAPNFIWRFSLGKTDYELGIQSFERFKWEYDYYGRDVWQQTLNLSNDEKIELIRLLEENYKHENRVYRYNFFYDNCATRPRDKIEESINGKVVYQPIEKAKDIQNYRDIIYLQTRNNPWSRFGMDFCVGSEADRPISNRELMFSPFYLMDAFENGVITTNDSTRNLVSETFQVVYATGQVNEAEWWEKLGDIFTPIRSALLLFIFTTLLTIYGIKKKKGLWGLDLVLFALAGLAGCVITFLALFSDHPAVSQNYLLFIFHPGQLLFLPYIIYTVRKGKICWYHVFNFVVLTLFIVLFPLIPQRINLAVVPLALCLLIRSLSNLILTYKKNK